MLKQTGCQLLHRQERQGVKRMHRTVMDILRETMPCLNFRMVKVDMTKNI